MGVFLGIDGGGSSCRALAVDQWGLPVFHGAGGAANVATVPVARLKANLQKATGGCPSPDVVCGCFAGILTANDKARTEELLSSMFPEAKVVALPDYAAALRASNADVCIIAGTGSLICSQSGDELVRSGGRGYLFGDYASSYRLGHAVVMRLLDYLPECSESTLQAAQRQFGSLDASEILSHIYGSGTPAGTIGKLLPAFVADFRSGQAYALETLEVQLGLLARQTARHLAEHFAGSDVVRIGLAGGVWKAAAEFVDRFREILDEVSLTPGATLEVSRITEPPVRGAAQLALEHQP